MRVQRSHRLWIVAITCFLLVGGQHPLLFAAEEDAGDTRSGTSPSSAKKSWKSAKIVTTAWVSVGGGSVEYEEHVTIEPIDSNWEGNLVRLDGGVDIRDVNNWLFKGAFGFWAADDDRERWSEFGDTIQENDLSVSGFDVQGMMGYPVFEDPSYTIAPFVGLEFHHTGFERSDFVSFRDVDVSDIGTVEEDYTIFDMVFALSVYSKLTERLSFNGLFSYGYVFHNEADNDALGEIDGDGGDIITLTGSLGYRLKKNHELFLGVRYFNQDLDGGQDEIIAFNGDALVRAPLEWPDNELNLVTVEIGWRGKL